MSPRGGEDAGAEARVLRRKGQDAEIAAEDSRPYTGIEFTFLRCRGARPHAQRKGAGVVARVLTRRSKSFATRASPLLQMIA